MTTKTWALPLAIILLAGCGYAQPAGTSPTLGAQSGTGAVAAKDAASDLAAFLKGDPTFQGTGVNNAFKVASLQSGGTMVVQIWYRDLSGYFGNTSEIQAVYGAGSSGHQTFQTYSLTQLRPGFYQMNFSQPATSLQNPVVAFHVANKWDSNLGRNYGIHFQPFPTQPW